MKGRIYDPVLGRFTSMDPLVGAHSGASAWNPYSYVMNNPVRYRDPSGYTAAQEYQKDENEAREDQKAQEDKSFKEKVKERVKELVADGSMDDEVGKKVEDWVDSTSESGVAAAVKHVAAGKMADSGVSTSSTMRYGVSSNSRSSTPVASGSPFFLNSQAAKKGTYTARDALLVSAISLEPVAIYAALKFAPGAVVGALAWGAAETSRQAFSGSADDGFDVSSIVKTSVTGAVGGLAARASVSGGIIAIQLSILAGAAVGVYEANHEQDDSE